MVVLSNRQKGFTVIELMVASILLITAISMVTLIYRSNVSTALAAERKIDGAVVHYFVVQEIKETLRVMDSQSGQGRWGEHDYQWRVVSVSERWSKAGYDAEVQSVRDAGRKLKLKIIEVQVNNTDTFEFSTLTWV